MSEARPPYVQFEIRAVEDRTASEESGHYSAKDVVFAIVTPAGTKDRIEKAADDWILGIEEGVKQERIPAEWLHAYQGALSRFKESRENPEFGSPILNWPSLSPAQSKTLLDINIRTIEELADANEETISRIGMGGRALKAKAQAWLDSASGTGKIAQEIENLRQENAELKSRDAERDVQFKSMQAALERLEAKEKPAKAVKEEA